jgi:hypothetical protein
MTDRAPPTIEEHAEFLRDWVRLHLWFLAHWLRGHPEEDFRSAMRTRVDIFRKTDLNLGPSKNTKLAGDFALPEWLALEDRALSEWERTRGSGPDAFEEAAWGVFRAAVEARVPRDFSEGHCLGDFQFGSLRCHDRASGPNKCVMFHIGNRVAPASMFDDYRYLPDCFFQLMRYAREKYGAEALATGSWLNSYPRWLALFPRSWRDNMRPQHENVEWSLTYWGQFLNGRGLLNRKHAAVLRATGEMPFKVRSSKCSFRDMEEHLRDYLARGGRPAG